MDLPNWALRPATANDREYAREARSKLSGTFEFTDRKGLRGWMKGKKWKASWLLLETSFFRNLFESDNNFQLALAEGIITIKLPKAAHQINKEHLDRLDKEYGAGGYDFMVEPLREIRRALEAEVGIEIEGKKMKSVSTFISWVNERYPLIEEGADEWFGHR